MQFCAGYLIFWLLLRKGSHIITKHEIHLHMNFLLWWHHTTAHSSTLSPAPIPPTMMILWGDWLATKHRHLWVAIKPILTHSPSTSLWMELTGDLSCMPPMMTSCSQRVAAVDAITGRRGRGFQERVRGDVIGLSLECRAWRKHE